MLGSRARLRGFTMIEILISLVILAVGLLGLAGLESAGIRSNHSAYLRTVATVQAYDIADRMRANPAGVATGGYNNTTGADLPACLTATGCTPAELAGFDVFEWQQFAASVLPSATAVVCIDNTPDDGTPAAPGCDNAAGASYVAKLWWNDTRKDGDLQRFVTSFRP